MNKKIDNIEKVAKIFVKMPVFRKPVKWSLHDNTSMKELGFSTYPSTETDLSI